MEVLLLKNSRNFYKNCFLFPATADDTGTKVGGGSMNIIYNDKTDLLYSGLDDRKQDVINRRVMEDIVLDIGVWEQGDK